MLAVRLTPKGGRDAIDGVMATPDGNVLKVRVSAPPEDGKANEALERLIAKWLGVSRGSVSLSAGGKSRNKTVLISGNHEEIATTIESLLIKSD